MKLLVIKKMAVIDSTFRQKRNLVPGTADIMMGLYLVISLVCRFYLIPILLLNKYNQIQTMVVALTISFVLTFIFIKTSNYCKLDWRGKKKSSLIAFLVNKLSKIKCGYILLCIFLFVFDPFLFFIYFKNGTSSRIKKILAWILLLLSLTLASFLWMKFGTKTKIIF